MREGFDVGLEMSGNGKAFRQLLEVMNHGGRVALDRGDRALAREILGRAETVKDPLTRSEFVLQEILLDALDGRPALAREHLEAQGRHPWNPDYPALAEAAVLLAEGRMREAREALERWDRLVASFSPVVRVGNEWAEEALRERLASVATSAGGR